MRSRLDREPEAPSDAAAAREALAREPLTLKIAHAICDHVYGGPKSARVCGCRARGDATACVAMTNAAAQVVLIVADHFADAPPPEKDLPR